jgi:hypothetical protein
MFVILLDWHTRLVCEHRANVADAVEVHVGCHRAAWLKPALVQSELHSVYFEACSRLQQ